MLNLNIWVLLSILDNAFIVDNLDILIDHILDSTQEWALILYSFLDIVEEWGEALVINIVDCLIFHMFSFHAIKKQFMDIGLVDG